MTRQSPIKDRKTAAKSFKVLNIRIDSELHDMLMHLSIELNITATEIISQYLKYLKAKYKTKRKPLNESSNTDNFTLAVDDDES